MVKLHKAAQGAPQELHDAEEAERRALRVQASPLLRDAVRLARLPADDLHGTLVRGALHNIRNERAETEARRLTAAASGHPAPIAAEARKSELAPPAAPEPQRAPKRWTADRLDELRAYRAEHGTKKAAEHFGVSESRVRVLLPSDNPPPRGFSVFAQRQK